jgi:mevalonate kinase
VVAGVVAAAAVGAREVAVGAKSTGWGQGGRGIFFVL